MKKEVDIKVDVLIREINKYEIGQVITLLKDNIESKIYPLTIYCSPGYNNYLGKIIRSDSHLTNNYLFGAFVEEKLVGFVNLKKNKSKLHLNNIHVSSNCQGKGVGKALFDHYVQFAKKYGIGNLFLDVFESNIQARKWYEKKGFKKILSTYWYYIYNPFDSKRGKYDIEILDFPQSEIIQKEFGFSKMQVLYKNNDFEIGRIHNELYKVNENVLDYPELLKNLKKLQPHRKLLVVSYDKNLMKNYGFNDYLIKAVTSYRMHSIIDTRFV
ncbi:GNAT family N-acetyltransferase [Alteribacillus sp. HJP-4]|uniref:GNAT family N-acetyltransferase n=1 Tax=Alteribacillus sp. HJP-4 TaxID=2775394 RepID=UPI0035CD0C2C